MKKSELILLENRIAREVVTRRSLGGYSTDAAGLLLLAESCLLMVRHMIATYPPRKSPAKKDDRVKAA